MVHWFTARELAARAGVSLRTAEGWVAAHRGTDAVRRVRVSPDGAPVRWADALRVELADEVAADVARDDGAVAA